MDVEYKKGEIVWYWNATFTSKGIGLIVSLGYQSDPELLYYKVLTSEGILTKTDPWLYPLK